MQCINYLLQNVHLPFGVKKRVQENFFVFVEDLNQVVHISAPRCQQFNLEITSKLADFFSKIQDC